MTLLTRKQLIITNNTCLALNLALNKCLIPNGHLTSAWLQLCFDFQPGCARHSPRVVLRTPVPYALIFPHPILEMHPRGDQNKGFRTTWHKCRLNILIMGETFLHSNIYTHLIILSHCPAPMQTLVGWADRCQTRDSGCMCFWHITHIHLVEP